ncbi:hypothetical protein T265_02286 [Opisthorchis viverrini]|uniref:Peptidase S1 domain-containing protein n=1 Tax=Opisthorchis viverrini TaxID=6198 RepID=A0A075AIF0_OPIVI|nr:hypothetical protein T265_02286 [Opisthorchis viverrini]KER31519.1 hypothetical protein T265_02286 [Opisthorchis viverrini]
MATASAIVMLSILTVLEPGTPTDIQCPIKMYLVSTSIMPMAPDCRLLHISLMLVFHATLSVVTSTPDPKEEDFPLVVRVQRHGAPDCVGTIIAANWIITAASCCDTLPSSGLTWRVILGNCKLPTSLSGTYYVSPDC